MADRYWVGGSGTWNSSNTTNWSATSGGAGGASAPTSVDDVFFDVNSNIGTGAFTVTITAATCRDFTASGLDGAMVVESVVTNTPLDVHGSMTLPATNLTWSPASGITLTFRGTTSNTLTTNGNALNTTNVTLDAVGGTLSLGSAITLNSTRSFIVTNGTFTTTASNYSISAGGISSNNSNIRSISLNASAVTLTGTQALIFTTATNLTFNAGTSTITCTATSPVFNGGGLTYNNVTLSSTTGSTSTIQGANTFNNLTQTSLSALGRRTVVLTADQIINGTLTLGAANTSTRRIQVVGTTVTGVGVGTPITLTVATIATLADVDFRDIVAAGASGTWSGTRLGNAGGNSNITFDAGVNKYWNLAAGGSWSTTAWALTSGGAVSANNFPLAQDTVIIEDTGLTAGNTITVNSAWFIGTIDASTRTTAFTLASGTDVPYIVGSYTIPSVATVTGTGIWYFQGVGVTQNITTNGVSLTFPINCNGSTTNIVRLVGNLTTTNTVTLQQGTLNLNNNVLSVNSFDSNNSGVRTLAFGTGKIVLTATTGQVLSMSTATNFTYTGTSRIEVTASGAGRTITPTATNAVESNVLNIYVTTGSDTVTVSGSARFLNFDLTGFAGTLTYSSSTRYFGDLVFSSGMALGTVAGSFTFAKTSGTQTITSAGKTIDNSVTIDAPGATVRLQDAMTLGATRTVTLTNGTLNLAGYTLTTGLFSSTNSNVRTLAFGSTGKFVLTGASGTLWTTSTSTNLTVTGTNPLVQLTTNVPLGTTRGIIFGAAGEANSISVDVTAGADQISLSTTSGAYRDISAVGFTGSLNFSNSIAVFGNFDVGTATALTGTGSPNFAATSGTKTIRSNGVTFPDGMTFSGIGGAWTLLDNLTLTNALAFTGGTLNLGSYTISCNNVGASGSNTRAINFGTGKIVVTGRDQTVWTTGTGTGLTFTGTRTVEVTGVGVSGETRSITGPSIDPSTENVVDLYIKAGADIINLGTANRFYRTLDFTGFSGVTFGNVAPQMYGNLVLSSTMAVTGGVNVWGFVATTSQTITTNGVTINNPIRFDGVGGTWTMQDALTLDSASALTLVNGTLRLKNGTTNTVGSITTTGTNQKFLQSTVNGSRATLSAATGVSDVSYVTVKDSAATGGARFQAFTSNGNVNAGNNVGWYFINAVGFLSFF